MDIITLILRTVLLYFLILLAFRVMGKREIGELSILDLVIFIMLAELAVLSIEDTDVSLLTTIVPMTVLVVVQVGMAYLSLKSQWLREFIDGKPSILINKGKIDEKEMRKQRYNFDDLMIQLREKDIKSAADVEFAILEPSGKLSVFAKEDHEDASEGLAPLPLVIDGVIQTENLAVMEYSKEWLLRKLKDKGYDQLSGISYCSINEDGEIFVDKEDEEKK
ncbi:DUF421 domain-containing protein [Bacillus solimangrovi]|uniref:YetF C-terminal domain-containing protein n=1 Tax=Bacillus solimangrovi TaxID=1305675 RepID=A0A1E5LBP7_9BACI|nr:DUF421 domain-containing protein [Bacillus solimangrovi]OEH91490.1 hypothetical protein BFG57_05080 [Bacillus solimangrovi]